MTSLRRTYIFVYLMICSSIAYGQLSAADSVLRSNSIHQAKEIYKTAIAGNAQVFNGVEYIDPLQKKKLDGIPYFLNDEWQDGFVFYGDQLYEDVSLRYDLFLNKLLIEHIQSHATIELIIERIKYFGIGNHTFVWLADSGDFKEGFHEILYSGNVKVYTKRYKNITEVIDQKVMVTKFLDKTKLFLYKDGQYVAIINKSSALNAFGEDKPAIKKFISQMKINFRSDPEMALTAMAKYYDELKK